MRMQALLEIATSLRCKVTFVADNLEHRQPYVDALQRRGVEVLFHPYVRSVADLLMNRGGEFDAVMLSRHYVAARHVDTVRRFAPQARMGVWQRVVGPEVCAANFGDFPGAAWEISAHAPVDAPPLPSPHRVPQAATPPRCRRN